MNRTDDYSQLEWIERLTSQAPFGRIARLLPDGFNAYARILHPIFEDPTVADLALTWHRTKPDDTGIALWDKYLEEHPEIDETATLVIGSYTVPADAPRVLWSEVARRLGQHLTAETDYHEMMRRAGFPSWPRYLLGPAEGTLSSPCLDALVEVLAGSGETGFNFSFWPLSTSDFEGGVYHGSLEEVGDLLAEERITGSPQYWFDDERLCCVCTDPDATFTVVGGPNSLVESLMEHPDLEAQRVTPDSIWS